MKRIKNQNEKRPFIAGRSGLTAKQNLVQRKRKIKKRRTGLPAAAWNPGSLLSFKVAMKT